MAILDGLTRIEAKQGKDFICENRIRVPLLCIGKRIAMLDKMNEFFNNRIAMYDKHMMTNIEPAA